MSDKLVHHWEETDTANTTTAKDGIRIETVIEVIIKDDRTKTISMNVSTTNFAMMDDATGAVRVALMKNGEEQSSYLVKSPRNPGRGVFKPTVRNGSREEPLPDQLVFNRIGLKFFNLDYEGEPMDLMKIIEIGAEVVVKALSERV